MPQSTIFADTGNGATLTFATTVFAAKIVRIEPVTFTRNKIEVSTLDLTAFKKQIQGDLTETPEFRVTFMFDTFLAVPLLTTVPETITITFPTRTGETTAANIAGTAFFREVVFPTLANGEAQQGSMIIAYDGGTGPTWSKSA